jgi:putative hemolysin
MKRLKIIMSVVFFLNLILCNHIFSQKINMPNPAAKYCVMMGYRYSIEKDEKGNLKSVCVLPDSSRVDPWDFLYGKVGKQYSYCAKKGYMVITQTIQKDGYTTECPVCTKGSLKSESSNDTTSQEVIPMFELMKKNGDLLFDSTINRGNGTNPIKNLPSTQSSLKSATSLPSSFDWRSYNGHSYIGPVRDQGACGSCYAFAITACAEGVFNYASNLYDNNRANFSESFVVWCLGSNPNMYSYGCCGLIGANEDVVANAVVQNGICDSSSFLYTINNPGTCTHWNDPHATFSSYRTITNGDENAIKTAIMSYGVVTAMTYACNWSPLTDCNTTGSGYSSGIWNEIVPSSYGTDHVVAIVGWGNDATYGDYWIVRNSWNSSWGENGYMRITVNSDLISSFITYFVPTSVTYEANPITESIPFQANTNVNLEGQTSVTLNSGFNGAVTGNGQLDVFSTIYSPLSNTSIPTSLCSGGSGLDDCCNALGLILGKSDATQVVTVDNNNGISIYPNPSFDKLTVKGLSKFKATLFDTYGREVISVNKIDDNIIDISNLRSGIYIIQLESSGKTYNQKVVKQ